MYANECDLSPSDEIEFGAASFIHVKERGWGWCRPMSWQYGINLKSLTNSYDEYVCKRFKVLEIRIIILPNIF
jgi:hypothetical protein